MTSKNRQPAFRTKKFSAIAASATVCQRYYTSLPVIKKETENKLHERLFICERLVVVYLFNENCGHPSFITKLETGKIEMAFVMADIYRLIKTAFGD